MKSVAIIGAGPGGVMTALFLQKLNIPFVIYDKSSFPRDKICGDALSGKVVEVFKKYDENLVKNLSVQPEAIGSWGVTFVAPNLKALRVPFKKKFDKNTELAPGFLIPRYYFDDFLVKELTKITHTDVEQQEISDFEYTSAGINIHLKNGKVVEHEMVIGADGAHSIVAKKLAQMTLEPEHYCAGIRTYYENVAGLDQDNFIELHFLKEFLPGYLWIFPLANGKANVGVGMRSDYVSKKKVNLKKELQNILKNHPSFAPRFKDAILLDAEKGFGLPLGSKKNRPISGNRFLLVGDAGSLIDPFTGEGIGNALMSGMFAAQVAAEAYHSNQFDATFLKKYDSMVYQRLGSELQLSTHMQKLVNYPWLFNLVVNKAEKSQTLKETISCMFEDLDMRKKLSNPLFYLKILFNF